jgi:hypothetical protein
MYLSNFYTTKCVSFLHNAECIYNWSWMNELLLLEYKEE